MERFTELAACMLQVPIALVYLCDAGQLKLAARVGAGWVPMDPCLELSIWAGTRSSLVWIEDVTMTGCGYPALCQVSNPLGLRFYAGVPLVDRGGKTMGVLAVADTEPRSPQDWQRQTLQVMGDRLRGILLEAQQGGAIAFTPHPLCPLGNIDIEPRILSCCARPSPTVMNTQVGSGAVDVSQSRASEVGFFAAFSKILSDGESLSDTLQQVAEAIAHYLQAVSVELWICQDLSESSLAQAHEERMPLSLRAWTGIAAPLDLPAAPAHLQQLLMGKTLEDCLPSGIWDMGENSLDGLPRRWGEGVVQRLVYPLLIASEGACASQRCLGVCVVLCRHPLAIATTKLLEATAGMLAVAVDRAWMRENHPGRREALLFKLAGQIRESLNINTILETTVTEIRNLLQIDYCSFVWCLHAPLCAREEDRAILTITHEAHNPNLRSLMGDRAPHLLGMADKIRHLETIRIDTVSEDPSLDDRTRQALQTAGITSQLLLPLSTHSGQFGAVVCSHCGEAHPWSNSEVELLQAVVDQLAIAIDQAEAYAQSRAAALAAQTQAQQLAESLRSLKQKEAQLIQNEKMSSLGQMVAGIAHEINNPVNFITGNLTHAHTYIQDLLALLDCYQEHYPNPVPEVEACIEAIDLPFLAEDLPKLLTSMEVGTERIRQIVVSLRNFSRLDQAEMKPVDIHEGIDSTLLILNSRLKPRGDYAGVEVIKEYGTLPKVDCYPGQLNQVFMNILANAIDALEQQPYRCITIRTETCGEDAIVRIRDNGSGMTEEVKKRLFDPFFTTKPVGKGTGLGLSISYQIVTDKHGGTLECASVQGEGTEFVIKIPIKQPDIQEPGNKK